MGKLMILPNAWDAGSAVIFERVGFEAVGTTSAGIAYSLGYPDGEQVVFEDVVTCVERILARISVPLSVDLETGYGSEISQVVENVRRVIDLGAVGINIEDGVTTPKRLAGEAYQCDLIGAIYQLKEELEIPFVINARTDVYWLGIGDPETRLDTALTRANAYVKAGADCIFIPGKLSSATVRQLVQSVPASLNIIAVPNGVSITELEALGVARLSLGSAPVRAALGITQTIAKEIQDKGSLEAVAKNALSYDAANELFRP